MSENGAPANAVPSGREPVSMSWLFGWSVRPLTELPFSSIAVALVRLLLGECRSATFCATTTPLALRHGPAPMRSRR
jgi:hypothetical protein